MSRRAVARNTHIEYAWLANAWRREQPVGEPGRVRTAFPFPLSMRATRIGSEENFTSSLSPLPHFNPPVPRNAALLRFPFFLGIGQGA